MKNFITIPTHITIDDLNRALKPKWPAEAASTLALFFSKDGIFSEEELEILAKSTGWRVKTSELRSACMKWLDQNGFSCHVVESKAVYSHSAGRYLGGQTSVGFSDIVGVTPNGIAAFIEVKAPGRLSTAKPHQIAFLLSKAKLGAFAVVVDSVDLLERVYQEFEHRRKMSPDLGKNLLLRRLARDGEKL